MMDFGRGRRAALCVRAFQNPLGGLILLPLVSSAEESEHC